MVPLSTGMADFCGNELFVMTGVMTLQEALTEYHPEHQVRKLEHNPNSGDGRRNGHHKQTTDGVLNGGYT